VILKKGGRMVRKLSDIIPGVKRTEETLPSNITYKVMLIDYFEGDWITIEGEEYAFADKNLAIQSRDERNLIEFKTTTPRHDHYCVIEIINGQPGHEVDCPATFKVRQ
jgi:hypothetical protein